MNWTDEDVKLTEKLIQIKNKGLYADGRQVCELYNRVFSKKVPITNCSSCLRSYITRLESALNRFKQQIALETPPEQKEEPTEAENKVKKKGRPKKK